MIKWHPYPQEKPQENENYLVAIKWKDDTLIVETDYWQGWWDDNQFIEKSILAWAEIPTLEEFKKEMGVSDEQ